MSDLPAPMTPANCELRGMPYMPLDVVRLIDSDLFALSTGDEFKAAVALWCKSWLQIPAGSLPDDDRVLAHLSSTGPAWKLVKDMALRGWVKCSDGRFYHPVVAEKACVAWNQRLTQRGKAAKRWGKRTDTDPPPKSVDAAASKTDAAASNGECTGNAAEHDQNSEKCVINWDTSQDTGNQCTGNAAASDLLTHSNVIPMQARGTLKEVSKLSLLSDSPNSDRGTRLPEEWQPNESEAAYALSKGLDFALMAEEFRDHFHSKTGKEGRSLKWSANWQRWCRNAAKWRNERVARPVIPSMPKRSDPPQAWLHLGTGTPEPDGSPTRGQAVLHLLAEEVCQAAGIQNSHFDQWGPLLAWLDADLSPKQIMDGIKRRMSKGVDSPIQSLNYFNAVVGMVRAA